MIYPSSYTIWKKKKAVIFYPFDSAMKQAHCLVVTNNEHLAPWMEMSSELATREKRRIRARERSVRKCLINGNKNH